LKPWVVGVVVLDQVEGVVKVVGEGREGSRLPLESVLG